MLRARLGGLQTPGLVRFLARLLLAAVVSTGLTWALGEILPGSGDGVSHALAGLRVVVLGGVDITVFLLLARAMRLREVTEVIDVVMRRLPGARAS
jgi:putative peptidoglycan lipid II flippase